MTALIVPLVRAADRFGWVIRAGKPSSQKVAHSLTVRSCFVASNALSYCRRKCSMRVPEAMPRRAQVDPDALGEADDPGDKFASDRVDCLFLKRTCKPDPNLFCNTAVGYVGGPLQLRSQSVV